jgi:carbamoylphosphate synthase small subunit
MRDPSADVFSIQYHPEAAPGPLDSTHLFARFRDLVEDRRIVRCEPRTKNDDGASTG